MTRSNASRQRKTHEEIERHYFEQFREAYPLPEGIVSYGDKPDVTLTGERKIGIEVTRFYLQPGSLADSDQRQQPLRTAIVDKAHALFRAGGGKGIELTIDFDRGHPITSPRSRILPEELVALVGRIDRTRQSGTLDRREFCHMPELSYIYFLAREFPDEKWHVIGNYTVKPMSSELLERIVREKEAKSIEYQRRDAYWLLVIVDWIDPAQEQEIRIDGLRISSDVFEKVIVYKPNFQHIVEAKP